MHRFANPARFQKLTAPVLPVLWLLAAGLIAVGLYLSLFGSPPDYQQGDSVRIMYVHVPAAMLAQSLYIGMGVAGFVGLVWRMKLADVAISACLPLGMMVTALALFSGSVWGAPTWGSWWEWDSRTVSTLVLFFLYVGNFALREAILDSTLRARASALIAMVGTINIPIIKYSVEWWNTLHQPASFSLTAKPTMPSEMWLPLLVMVLAFYGLFTLNLLMRMRLEVLRRENKTRWARAALESNT